MSRRLFVIDLARCTGCYTCSIACKDRAGLPDQADLLRVDRSETGVYPRPSLLYRVGHCFHCAEPPCVDACPTGAISKGVDGLVSLDRDECTGCWACIHACPFGAIAMLPEGIAAKCDGCRDEIARGWDPTCVRACPMRALRYEPLSGTPGNRVGDPGFDDHDVGPAVSYLAMRSHRQ